VSASAVLKTALEGIGEPAILIVGDLILDRYVTGEVTRISPEAPIPVLAVHSSHDRVGGAGNVAANLCAMGARTELVSVVGDDGLGRATVEMLDDLGIDASGCIADGARPTTVKTRMVSGVQQMMRVDWEEAVPVSDGVADQMLDGLAERVARVQCVVLSDYGKGVLVPRVLEAVIRAAREAGVPVLVDPKGSDYTRYRGATLVTPNRKEAEQALGRKLADLDLLPAAAEELMKLAELDAAVITLGADGIFHRSKDGSSGRVPTVAQSVFDVTGAGDTVIANLALGLAGGLSLEVAVELANHAAGLVVGRRGAVAIQRDEMLAALGETQVQRGKILAGDDVESVIASWRAMGKRIVFTNGCFDILHAGHVHYLRFARSKGDVLLVGLNDDASVRRLKGPERPVNSLQDRLEVIAALEMVDGVVAFTEDTPAEIVRRVTPDILVKGEDWADKGVVGREWVEKHGGEVHLAPLVPGRSTTSILERGRPKD